MTPQILRRGPSGTIVVVQIIRGFYPPDHELKHTHKKNTPTEFIVTVIIRLWLSCEIKIQTYYHQQHQ